VSAASAVASHPRPIKAAASLRAAPCARLLILVIPYLRACLPSLSAQPVCPAHLPGLSAGRIHRRGLPDPT